MTETAPQQQITPQDTEYIDRLHDVIANNELPNTGEYNWTYDGYKPVPPVSHEEGQIQDPVKAEKMAYAAKVGIDKVLGVVADRDYDIAHTHFSASLHNPDGSLIGMLPNPNGHGTQLVTKPRRVELRDNDGTPTGKTGVRREIYEYADLVDDLKDANKAADDAGKEYDANAKGAVSKMSPEKPLTIGEQIDAETKAIYSDPTLLARQVASTLESFNTDWLQKMREQAATDPSAETQKSLQLLERESKGFDHLREFADQWLETKATEPTTPDFATFMKHEMEAAEGAFDRALDAAGGSIRGESPEGDAFNRASDAYKAGGWDRGKSYSLNGQIRRAVAAKHQV